MFGVLLGAVVVFASGARLPEPSQSWEYTHQIHSGRVLDVDRFNELGNEGWEFVGHYTAPDGGTRGFVFKREVR